MSPNTPLRILTRLRLYIKIDILLICADFPFSYSSKAALICDLRFLTKLRFKRIFEILLLPSSSEGYQPALIYHLRNNRMLRLFVIFVFLQRCAFISTSEKYQSPPLRILPKRRFLRIFLHKAKIQFYKIDYFRNITVFVSLMVLRQRPEYATLYLT